MPRLSEEQFTQPEAELAKGPAAHGWEDQRWTLERIEGVIGPVHVAEQHFDSSSGGTSSAMAALDVFPDQTFAPVWLDSAPGDYGRAAAAPCAWATSTRPSPRRSSPT